MARKSRAGVRKPHNRKSGMGAGRGVPENGRQQPIEVQGTWQTSAEAALHDFYNRELFEFTDADFAAAKARVDDILNGLPAAEVVRIAKDYGLRSDEKSRKAAVMRIQFTVVTRLENRFMFNPPPRRQAGEAVPQLGTRGDIKRLN